MNIPYPRLLDNDMNEIRRITPIKASVNLNITPLSTATLVVDANENIQVQSWIEMFTSSGSAGIFLVKEVRTEYIGSNPVSTLYLEHGICQLAYGGINSTSEEYFTKTVDDALYNIVSVFGHNTHWEGGTAESDHEQVSYTFDAGTRKDSLDLLLEIMEQLPECMLEFDQTELPWKVNIVLKPTSVTCEGRVSRNVKSATITVDSRDLITRFVIGQGETIYLFNADTIDVYGLIFGFEQVDEDMTYDDMVAYGNRVLEKHKNPTVSIEIGAVDLSQITGESIDIFGIGKKCRLALPDHGIVKEETIVKMDWEDVYSEMGSCRITLAESLDTTIQTMIHKNDKTAVKKKRKV